MPSFFSNRIAFGHSSCQSRYSNIWVRVGFILLEVGGFEDHCFGMHVVGIHLTVLPYDWPRL